MTLTRDPAYNDLVAHVKANEEDKLRILEEFSKDSQRFEYFRFLRT